MKLKDIAQVADNDQLLGVLITAIKRAAHTIIAAPGQPQALIDWAKRARFTYKDDRTSYYASLILEAALNENQEVRDACAVALATAGSIELPDETLIPLVMTYVQRFATLNI